MKMIKELDIYIMLISKGIKLPKIVFKRAKYVAEKEGSTWPGWHYPTNKILPK